MAHHCIVYLDGIELGRHKGGFMPFELTVHTLQPGQEHLLSVAVDNRLDRSCLPLGELVEPKRPEDASTIQQTIHFDFFNFAGIHREVQLLWLPEQPIDGIRLDAICAAEDPQHSSAGHLDYHISVGPGEISVTLQDASGSVVGSAHGATGRIPLEQVERWGPGQPVLYTAVISLSRDGRLIDRYQERCGFRTVSVRDGTFLVNNQSVYLTGFGKHEDTVARGRAHDQVQMIKDYHLLEWIGANSFRTSHYPYHEDWLKEADERGILVIDETPAVGLWFVGKDDDHPFHANDPSTAARLSHHRAVMAELIKRDRNHPSVIMWSIANEPAT